MQANCIIYTCYPLLLKHAFMIITCSDNHRLP